MKIRAVDIARELNLSKATVSLALNSKPGVSPRTRQAVFACMKLLRNAAASEDTSVVKVIVVSQKLNIVCAFSNRDGGIILPGIKDNGEILGVAPEAIDRRSPQCQCQRSDSP